MDVALDPDPKIFKHRYKLSVIPVAKHRKDGDTRPETLIHASTYERANNALKEGIKASNDARCLILGSTILPLVGADDLDLELAIRRCKDRGVYLWNDKGEAMHQSLATVGILREDNPALLIVNSTDLEKDYDPTWTINDQDDPASYVHHGPIDKDRIECVCTLHEDLIPDIGQVMCPVIAGTDGECPSTDATDPKTYDALHNPDNWKCLCRAGKVSDAVRDSVLDELSRTGKDTNVRD